MRLPRPLYLTLCVLGHALLFAAVCAPTAIALLKATGHLPPAGW